MKLIFLGPPGAGKGTLAKMVSDELGIPQISTGDIFRQAVKDGTELGKKAKAIMERGDLVPDDVTVELVRERLGKADTHDGYILDGFPRTIVQADGLKRFQTVERVVNFQASDDDLIKRLTGRRTCRQCGRIYHVINMPPKVEDKCDADGTPLFVRDDDTIDAVRNRLDVYRRQTQPLIDYYEREGLLRHIDSSQTPQATLDQIRSILNRFQGRAQGAPPA
jgi:adenylate kinase